MTTAYVHHPHTPSGRKRQSGLLAMPLTVIGVIVAAATGFIIHVLWPRWPDPPIGPNAPALPITVAGVPFTVPPAAIRVAIQRQPGAHERVDLAFLWPSLQPPAPAASATGANKGAPRQQPFERIFVTIAAASEALPPAERVKTIYPRYAEHEPLTGPDGLSVLPFRQGTPYQGEDLIYDSVTPMSFLVRCSRNGNGPTPGICLLPRRIEGADVTVRFPRDWLEDWRSVAEKIDRLIVRLRPANS
jgi:hypothetical protein